MPNKNAKVMVHWPGNSKAMCRNHADYAQRAADAMGMPRATETPCEPQECECCSKDEAAMDAYERVVDGCCKTGEELVEVCRRAAAAAATFASESAPLKT